MAKRSNGNLDKDVAVERKCERKGNCVFKTHGTTMRKKIKSESNQKLRSYTSLEKKHNRSQRKENRNRHFKRKRAKQRMMARKITRIFPVSERESS